MESFDFYFSVATTFHSSVQVSINILFFLIWIRTIAYLGSSFFNVNWEGRSLIVEAKSWDNALPFKKGIWNSLRVHKSDKKKKIAFPLANVIGPLLDLFAWISCFYDHPSVQIVISCLCFRFIRCWHQPISRFPWVWYFWMKKRVAYGCGKWESCLFNSISTPNKTRMWKLRTYASRFSCKFLGIIFCV